MAKYITSFETLADYQAATLDYPNVSVINEDMNVIYTKEAPTPVFDGFCKLTLSDDSIIEIQGSGRLKEEMISQYKSTLVSVDVGALCTSIEGMTRNVAPPYGHQTFGNCPMLSTLKIGSNVRNFSWSDEVTGFDDVFTNSPNISSVVVSPRNSIIDSRDNCNAIIITSENKLIYGFKDTIIPDSVTSIGNYSFYGCSGLTSVTIPNSVTSIGLAAFGDCTNLTSIEIPNTVTSVGNYAFESCSSLTSVTIGSGVTSIGLSAFYGCTSLTSITIPNSVTSIDYWAFGGCSGLTSVTVEATTPPQLLGTGVFDNTNNCPIYVPSASVNAYKAASGWSNYASRIQAIPSPIGSNCYEVISTPITSYTPSDYEQVFSFADTKWYMKNNLDNMEEYGIYDVVDNISTATTYEGKLAAVGTTEYQYSGGSWIEVGTYEDSSVTYEIDNTASERYSGQELSTTFKVPISDVESAGMVHITINASDGGGTLEIRLEHGGEYTYEGDDSFQGTVTDDGEYFYLSLPSEAPQSIVIENIEYWNSGTIHIIAGSKNVTVEYDEKAIPLGNVYNTVADMEDDACPNIGVGQYGVVGNDAYQFNGTAWNTVNSIKLMEKNDDGKALVLACNSSTDLVEEEAKPSYFDNITDVVIGDCVTSIGNYAFKECSGLTSVDIPNSVTSIGAWAFDTCSSLSSVTIGSGVTSIGSMAFQNCSSLSSVTIGSGVTSIGDGAFQTCSSLTSVTIPNSVTTFGSQCFATCTGLTSVTIPNSVTSIGINAFINSNGLTSVTVEATTPPQLGINAFKNTNNCPIYVPSASVNAYKGATNWSSYASRIQAIP